MLENILSWNTVWYSLLALYIPSCLGLVVIVLLQKGKGTGFAGSFGVGAGPGSETVFGPRTGQTLPVKMTYFAAVVFVLISLGMSLIAGRVGKGRAPELVEGATVSASGGGVVTALDELGIGEGVQGAAATSAAPVPATVTPPVSTETAPAEEDAAPDATPAPATVTPPASAETAPSEENATPDAAPAPAESENP